MGKGFHESMLNVFTQHSQGTHTALTTHSQRTHKSLTKHSQHIHKTFTLTFTPISQPPRAERGEFFRPRTHEPERGNLTPQARFQHAPSTGQNAEQKKRREEESANRSPQVCFPFPLPMGQNAEQKTRREEEENANLNPQVCFSAPPFSHSHHAPLAAHFPVGGAKALTPQPPIYAAFEMMTVTPMDADGFEASTCFLPTVS